MEILVVYESMFGNTKVVADAVATRLAVAGSARAVDVGAVTADEVRRADVLVVGGPTHAWGMTTNWSRRSAATILRDRRPGPSPSLRRWLRKMEPVNRTPAAAFDTRLNELRISAGSAARGIARRLRRQGYELVVPTASFRVKSFTGPLVPGEIDKARAWADAIVAAVRPATVTR